MSLENDIRELKEIVSGLPVRVAAETSNPLGKIVKSDNAIPAISGVAVSSSTAKVWKINSDDDLVISSPVVTITVFNKSTAVDAENVFLQVKKIGNKWLVDVESCS